MQRHLRSEHSPSNLSSISHYVDFSIKVSVVSPGASFYLPGCRDDWLEKNVLGAIIVTTSSKHDQSATRELRVDNYINNLVLHVFVVATSLPQIIHGAKNNFKGIPYTLLLKMIPILKSTYPVCNLIVIDNQMIEVRSDN